MTEPGRLWEAASLPTLAAVRRAAGVTVAASVVVALGLLAAGWPWSLSLALGAAVVLVVLAGSTWLLVAGARRGSPVLALGLALLLYLAVVVGLFVLAVHSRDAAAGATWLRRPGVTFGALLAVLGWTGSLLVLHARHGAPARRRRG